MFNTDAKMLRQIAQHMQRVLIVDSQSASVRLLTDLLRDVAPCQVWTATGPGKGLALADQINPHLIFVEQDEVIDGANFTRKLRRSDYACRKAPVIMVTPTATAAAIIGARDAGVHEFLRKPYTIKDLVRRLEAVTLRSRDWVEAVYYVGPDRRRFNSGDYSGPLKRNVDNAATPDVARIIQSLKIFRAAVSAVEIDPHQALRAMRAQATDLREAAVSLGHAGLAAAAAEVQQNLQQANVKSLSRPKLESHLKALWTFMPAEGDAAKSGSAAAA